LFGLLWDKSIFFTGINKKKFTEKKTKKTYISEGKNLLTLN